MKSYTKIFVITTFILITFANTVFADDATTTDPTATSTDPVATTTVSIPITMNVNLNLRYQDTLLFSGSVNIVQNGTTTVADNTGTNHDIKSDTVLSALESAENLASTTSPTFSLSNLHYYSSFNSFILDCVKFATSTSNTPTDACYNWQYVVNGNYPFIGMDSYDLSSGDTIYIYFGTPRIVSVATSTITVGNEFSATALSYDYSNNVYVGAPNLVLGVTQPDPSNPWSPIVIATSSSDSNGVAKFTINLAGNYGIGIESDYYGNLTPITIASSTTSTTTSPIAPVTSGGGGGGGSYYGLTYLNPTTALSYLISKQSIDGSFGEELYSDWGAIALASASGVDQNKNLLADYFKNNSLKGNLVTDYERHAMALEALGINPYSGTSVNYISKITSAFDGNQIGDVGLFNDDIFAIFPLIKAGYTISDPEISKVVSFIISKQSPDGGWGSVDMTSASIQTLELVQGVYGVSDSISKAKNYLKNNQASDGGFGNISATTWAIQAIDALGENPIDWTNGGNNPLSYLGLKQYSDGGMDNGADNNTRVWETSYAIPAYYGKTWNSLLNSFPKNIVTVGGGSSGSYFSIAPSSSATSTILGTTTLNLATSTPAIFELGTSTASSTIIINPNLGTTTKKVTAKISRKIFAVPAPLATSTQNNPNNNLTASIVNSGLGTSSSNGILGVFHTTASGLGIIWHSLWSFLTF